MCAYFKNGDGVLALRDPKDQKYKPQRLLLTDSGHYLLPLDHFHSKQSTSFDHRLMKDMSRNLKHIKDSVSHDPPTLFAFPVAQSSTATETVFQ